MSIFLESYVFFKIFLCLQTKVCLFTFSMFIYQNFQKFRGPVSKFFFVYKQRFVYLHFQCLFTFFIACFEKILENDVKFSEYLEKSEFL